MPTSSEVSKRSGERAQNWPNKDWLTNWIHQICLPSYWWNPFTTALDIFSAVDSIRRSVDIWSLFGDFWALLKKKELLEVVVEASGVTLSLRRALGQQWEQVLPPFFTNLVIVLIIIICCKTLNSLFLNYNIWRRQDLPPAPSDHSKVRAPAQAQVGKPTSVELLRLAQAPQMSGARPREGSREGSGKPTSWQACSFSEGEHNLQDNDKREPAKRDHCCFLLSFKYRDQLIFLWLGVEGTYWEGS